MSRLTIRNTEGLAVYKQSYNCERCGESIWRLPDLGNGSPTEKLANYEDAEEQGLIFRLPCNIGDTVYVIDGKNIHELKAENDIALISGELCIFVENARYADYISYKNLGETVFLKKEEAEQKLMKSIY